MPSASGIPATWWSSTPSRTPAATTPRTSTGSPTAGPAARGWGRAASRRPRARRWSPRSPRRCTSRPNVDYRSTYHRPKEADHWFDTQLYTTSDTPIVRNYDLALDDAVTGAPRQVTLPRAGARRRRTRPRTPTSRCRSCSTATTSASTSWEGSGLYQWEGSTDTTVAATLPAAWLNPASNQVSLVAARTQLPGLSYYWISPDYVELTYPALADADGTDRIYIEAVAPGANEVRVTGFTTAGVGVYDIRDPRHPVQLTTTAFDERHGHAFLLGRRSPRPHVLP